VASAKATAESAVTSKRLGSVLYSTRSARRLRAGWRAPGRDVG
jgi:hypothetical protein